MTETKPTNVWISGKVVVTVRNPDGTVKHVEEMEVQTE